MLQRVVEDLGIHQYEEADEHSRNIPGKKNGKE